MFAVVEFEGMSLFGLSYYIVAPLIILSWAIPHKCTVFVVSCSDYTRCVTWIHTECPPTNRIHCSQWKRVILAPLDWRPSKDRVVPSYHVSHVNLWLKVAPTKSVRFRQQVRTTLGETSQCVLGGEPCRGSYTGGQLLVVQWQWDQSKWWEGEN